MTGLKRYVCVFVPSSLSETVSETIEPSNSTRKLCPISIGSGNSALPLNFIAWESILEGEVFRFHFIFGDGCRRGTFFHDNGVSVIIINSFVSIRDKIDREYGLPCYFCFLRFRDERFLDPILRVLTESVNQCVQTGAIHTKIQVFGVSLKPNLRYVLHFWRTRASILELTLDSLNLGCEIRFCTRSYLRTLRPLPAERCVFGIFHLFMYFVIFSSISSCVSFDHSGNEEYSAVSCHFSSAWNTGTLPVFR